MLFSCKLNPVVFFGRFHLFVHFCDSRVYSPLFKCCTLQILWIAATALTFDISLSHYWTSLVVMYGKMLQGSHCWKFLFILIIMSKHVSEIVCILCSVNHSSEHPPNVTHCHLSSLLSSSPSSVILSLVIDVIFTIPHSHHVLFDQIYLICDFSNCQQKLHPTHKLNIRCWFVRGGTTVAPNI